MLPATVLLPLLVSGPVQDESPGPSALLAATAWEDLVQRDARLSFTPGGAREARADLEAGIEVPILGAVALMALGSGGAVTDRPRLEDAARNGTDLERPAAVLALGELNPPGVAVLRAIAAEGDPVLAPCAAFALARAGTPDARATVEGWATGAGELAAAARAALAFADAPGNQVAARTPTAELFLNLRWGAARLYGFVDGMKWKVQLADELAQNERFLDRVVLTAARELRAGPRRDHILELVLAGGPAERLRGATLCMPSKLAKLIESGLWRPANDAEWSAILDEIVRRGPEAEYQALLMLAAEVPAVARRAGLLLLAAGTAEAWDLVGDEALAPEPDRRVAIAEALGGVRNADRVTDLTRLRRDQDARVRAAALVALVRVGDDPAVDTLKDILDGGESAARSNAIEMLCRASHDNKLHGYLDDILVLSDITDDERLLVEVSLALHGRISMRESLRTKLLEERGAFALRELLVRALAQGADQRDLAVMRELFPIEDAFELNVELAVALIVNRDQAAVGLLRVAMWRPPWNRSVLAAGLLARLGGVQALHDELGSPPPRAGEEDFRRVGFALGEFGGLAEVEVLARRRRSGDPALQGAYLGALSTRTH